MYVDLTLLFLIYAFSVIAMGISVYALWTLHEVLEQLRNRPKPNNAWDHYHTKADQTTKTKSTRKGHWD